MAACQPQTSLFPWTAMTSTHWCVDNIDNTHSLSTQLINYCWAIINRTGESSLKIEGSSKIAEEIILCCTIFFYWCFSVCRNTDCGFVIRIQTICLSESSRQSLIGLWQLFFRSHSDALWTTLVAIWFSSVTIFQSASTRNSHRSWTEERKVLAPNSWLS